MWIVMCAVPGRESVTSGDDAVRYEHDGPVVTLTIDRPERRNALSAAVRAGLWDGLRRFEADDGARVLILTGAGDKAFCAGADLSEMAEGSLGQLPRDYMPMIGHNIAVSKPVIAAVNGVALGGGFLLAQTAHLAVASEHAVFGMPEVRWSRGAPWSVPLGRMVHRRHWLELALTGAPIDAGRAYEIGLVNRVIPGEELLAATGELAACIAANAPLTVAATLQMVRMSAQMGEDAGWDVADRIFEPVYRSEDAVEGPRAFREKRAPVWKGR